MGDVLFIVLRMLYVFLFFAAVFISLKFQWGKEGKDERGEQIANASYGIAFPFMLLGWFLIELYDAYITPLTYDEYKLAVWFLVTGLFILHAVVLMILRKIY